MDSGVAVVEAQMQNYPDAPQGNYPRLGVTAQKPVSRARLLELTVLAGETVAWLESKGLKQGEQCEFNNIAQRLWFAPK